MNEESNFFWEKIFKKLKHGKNKWFDLNVMDKEKHLKIT